MDFGINVAQKMKFSIKDFIRKYDQIHIDCGFGHIYWRNPSWKTSFFVHCDKCAYLIIGEGTIVSDGEPLIMNEVTIKLAKEGNTYKYLGSFKEIF